MLAEIFMLKAEAAARVAKEAVPRFYCPQDVGARLP
jgi:hypothetical protein